jgi:hypothetical protein
VEVELEQMCYNREGEWRGETGRSGAADCRRHMRDCFAPTGLLREIRPIRGE